MPRARFIRPEFFNDEKIGSLSCMARLLFIGSWTQADLNGVLEWNAKRLRAIVFPYDEDVKTAHVEAWMADIVKAGMVHSYEVGGASYGQIVNFGRHQSFTRSEIQSGPKYPLPAGAANERQRERGGYTRGENVTKPTDTVSCDEVPPEVPPVEALECGSPAPAPAPAPACESIASVADAPSAGREDKPNTKPSALTRWTFPCQSNQYYSLPVALYEKLDRIYGTALDLDTELDKAVLWCETNASKQKTPRGMSAFLLRWMNNNQGRAQPAPAAKSDFSLDQARAYFAGSDTE